MREWNSYSDDITIDGNEVKEYTIIFKTTEYEVYKRIEKFFQRLIDESNSSEKPNNCEVKNYCDDCLYTDVCDSKEFFYACTSKATISKMEQVDKDTNVRSKYDCKTCKHDLWHTPRMCGKCVRQEDGKPSMYEPKTEPQTDYTPDCPFCKRYGTEDCLGSDCRHYKTYKDEPQTEDEILREQCRAFMDIVEQTDCHWK